MHGIFSDNNDLIYIRNDFRMLYLWSDVQKLCEVSTGKVVSRPRIFMEIFFMIIQFYSHS